MVNEDTDVRRDEPAGKQRPLHRRLIHVAIEVVLSFVLAGGLFLELFHLTCLGHNNCESFGGIAYMIASFVFATFLSASYLGLCRHFRMRLAIRRNIDIAAAILTAIVWLAILVRELFR